MKELVEASRTQRQSVVGLSIFIPQRRTSVMWPRGTWVLYPGCCFPSWWWWPRREPRRTSRGVSEEKINQRTGVRRCDMLFYYLFLSEFTCAEFFVLLFASHLIFFFSRVPSLLCCVFGFSSQRLRQNDVSNVRGIFYRSSYSSLESPKIRYE